MFGKKTKDKNKEKAKKMTGDVIRVRIFRLINGTPVEAGIVDASLTRDNNNNSIVLNNEAGIKEELPGLHDSLVSDILYKLESRDLSRGEQIKKVTKAIENQDIILKDQKDGFIIKKVSSIGEDGKEVSSSERVKINIHTEKSKLRLFKCIKYTLENKKGEGYFESIELDGTRSLTYLVRDGDLIPYWHKTPNSDGEPVILVPDIVQRKKFWKEATDETINDFNESQDTKWRGILKTINKALKVILLLGLIIWTFYLARWSGDLRDESLQPMIDKLNVENARIKQLCSEQVANQIDNNEVLIDYAKVLIKGTMDDQRVANGDKGNIQI